MLDLLGLTDMALCFDALISDGLLFKKQDLFVSDAAHPFVSHFMPEMD